MVLCLYVLVAGCCCDIYVLAGLRVWFIACWNVCLLQFSCVVWLVRGVGWFY